MSQASTRLTLVIKRVRSARRRQADASVRAPLRDFTTIQDEGFNNGGLDVRFRKLWGDGTIFKGSALTFGGVVYHGDAPFTRFRNPDLFASRDSTEGVQTLDQDRTSDYQAVFAETLFRLGKFHIVPSFRLDHETVDVNTIIGPGATPGDPFNGHADRWVPVWGIGLGNDFGDRNETYFSASSGWRPVRFFDVASRFKFSRPVTSRIRLSPSISSSVCTGHPSKVFGTTSVCSGWSSIIARRLASSAPLILSSSTLEALGTRGLEGELSYDFLARFQHPPLVTTQPEPARTSKMQRLPPSQEYQ
jgi:Fe(3+) dicitrate transport protein